MHVEAHWHIGIAIIIQFVFVLFREDKLEEWATCNQQTKGYELLETLNHVGS